jgi:hypothetical protein
MNNGTDVSFLEKVPMLRLLIKIVSSHRKDPLQRVSNSGDILRIMQPQSGAPFQFHIKVPLFWIAID